MAESSYQSRRAFLRKSTYAGIGLVGLRSFEVSELPHDEVKSIVIVHTNDMHSHIEAFDNDHPKYPGLGGMAQRAAAIDKLREEHGDILLLDAGDIFQGTPYFNYFHGHLEIDLMTKMGYDAATMGNHDFDIGLEGFSQAQKKASFPFICSNYDFSDTLLQGKTKRHLILKRNGIRIGIFGLGVELDGLVDPRLCEGVRYNNPVQVAREMSSFLKQDKRCDLIICLSHLGYSYETDKISDTSLAGLVDGIDLIIGGHTHTFLDEPAVISRSPQQLTYINQVGWAGVRLGVLEFKMAANDKANGLSDKSMVIRDLG